MPFPKAGVVAELEGLGVAREIAAILKDESAPPPFNGSAHCFIETGTNEAAMFEAEFFAADGPKINFADVTTETSEEKHRFERDRLREWFPDRTGTIANRRSRCQASNKMSPQI